ncbi:MAG: hypothetical protein IJ515_06630 [Clostridia bacterium]|nr:hypothetical protein [Clostridia bacterium]
MGKGKKSGVRKTNASALVFGIIFTTAVFLLTALIGAAIAGGLKNPTGSIGTISLIVLMTTAAISGIAISKYKGEGGVFPSVLSSLFFTLVLLIIGLVLTKGHLPLIAVINLALFILVNTIFAYLGKKREPRRRRH